MDPQVKEDKPEMSHLSHGFNPMKKDNSASKQAKWEIRCRR
jgi:hypothetical protein